MAKTTTNNTNVTSTTTSATAKKKNTPRITLHVAKRYESMFAKIEKLATKWNVEKSNLIWYLLMTSTTFEEAEKSDKPSSLQSITQKKTASLEKQLGKLTQAQLAKVQQYLQEAADKDSEPLTTTTAPKVNTTPAVKTA